MVVASDHARVASVGRSPRDHRYKGEANGYLKRLCNDKIMV